MNAEHAKLTKAIREIGWNPAFDVREAEEYERFVFLAVTAGHPVSPSDAVLHPLVEGALLPGSPYGEN